MIFLAKIVIYFSMSFFLLCVPINRSPLFFHLYKLGGRYVEQGLLSAKREIVIKIQEGTSLGKRFFLNSLPDETKRIHRDPMKHSENTFTVEEKELLKKVFNN